MGSSSVSLAPFFERLEQIYDSATASGIRRSMEAPKRQGYFRNPLAGAADASAEPVREPVGEPIAGLTDCFAVAADERDRLLRREAVAGGAIYPINPSSVLAARSLNVAGATEVLDLAAAPGGKTLLLAAAMGNRGRIAAVEPRPGRYHRMRANLDRCGVRNVQCYRADGRSIGRKVPGRFDRVLLDAPCSSESRIRLAEPDSFDHWKLRKIKESARKQLGLIRSAFAALKPGGELVYCTCSFAPEENELIVAALLAREPEADLLPIPMLSPAATDVGSGSVASSADQPGRALPVAASNRAGLRGWRGKPLDSRLELTRRILPDDLWDGFYVARVRKLGG